jgi:hypothetical protein
MRALLSLVLLALLTGPATAYQVSGTFVYRDREFAHPIGFTGNEPSRPIRYADVEVVDANSQQLLGSTATDANGSFSLQVNDNFTRDIQVRVLTSSDNTNDLHIEVRVTASSTLYGVAHPTFENHSPAQNIDFTSTPVLAVQGSGGDGFNIFDQAVDAMDFIAFLAGSRPAASQSLTLFWAEGTSNGTYYSNSQRAVFLLGLSTDSDAWDDAVILHEIGHYVEFVFADSDNPGGRHFLNDCHDMRLTWSEGWSTFFENMVRDWKGIQRAEIYVDTTGQPGSGHRLISYEVETPSVGNQGAGNEVAVNAALWDVVDNLSTQDLSPGLDDDPMRINDGPQRVWDVMRNYIRTTATNITVEDFWDGWFARGHGNQANMELVFGAHGMEYFTDAFEDDGGVAKARDGGVVDNTTHHTIYGAGDSDWTRFAGVTGGVYLFTTASLPCGSDTRMELFDSDGTTLLAQNDDWNGGPGSQISWTAVRDGPVYLKVTRAVDLHRYAGYDLLVKVDSVPVVLTDFQVFAVAEGVSLEWRALRENGFSHFDVQRSDTRDGLWTTLNTEPIVADPEDATRFEFLDRDVEPGRTYFYRIVAVETNGESEAFGPFESTAAAPARMVLHPPRPNPFNPNTTLQFELPRSGVVWLRIYDVTGRLVRTLVRGEEYPAGIGSVPWNGQDDVHRPAASGVYLVRLDNAGITETQRAILVR